jgi:hypothetical protein
MDLKTIKESLIRRLAVNYVSYLGQQQQQQNKRVSNDWLEGYFQAKKDAENFLKQIEVFDRE